MRVKTQLWLATVLVQVDAWPYVGFPIAQQLPQIARIGEDYTFTLSQQTFKSDANSAVSYKAYNLPEWLDFDSDNMKLTGLAPGTGGGLLNFTLEGTDSQGSLNQTGQIYLSDEPAPYVNEQDTINAQLQSIGKTNGYSGIVLQPNEEFKLKFSKDTFNIPSGSSASLLYYGKSGNRTSLPSWCFFDDDSLTFSGQAPTINSKNAPSLNFDLTLIATDEPGFTAVYQDFSIIVGGHSLILNSTDYEKTVNTSAGDSFDLALPITKILLDDVQITEDEISDVSIADQPDWVSITKDSITGTVPEDQTSNVLLNVTLVDTYGDAIFMDFGVDVVHTIFKSQLPDIEAQRGQFLEFTLDSDAFNNLTAVSIEPTFDSTWLRFYHSNNTFVGLTPRNFMSMEVAINATLGSIQEAQSFKIVGEGSVSSSASRRSSSTMSRSASATGTATTQSITKSTATSTNTSTSSSSGTAVAKHASNKNALAIGLGVGIPVGVIFLVLLVLLWLGIIPLFRKRRSNTSPADEEKSTGDFGGSGGSGASETIVNSNLEKLESDGYSTGDDDKTFEDAVMYQVPQASTDQLLNEPKGVFNSWRARDSTNSLATVATNDLLTVNMVETHNARRSQLNIFRDSGKQLRTLNEETHPEWKDFNDKASVSKDENSEHSQTGIVESPSTHF